MKSKHLFVYACAATLCLAAFSSVSYHQHCKIKRLKSANRLWQAAAYQSQTNAALWKAYSMRRSALTPSKGQ